MLARYQRKAREFEAAYFDGSGEAARELAALFGGAVYFDGDRLEVSTSFGTVFAGWGVWVVRDVTTRQITVVDHREFDQHFEPIPDIHLRAADPMRPTADRWDVC